jgi:hypothetical protein
MVHLSLSEEQLSFNPDKKPCLHPIAPSMLFQGFSFAELDGHQQRMYSILVAVFFLTLSGYWLIRPMKMGVFATYVGIENEPQAKLGTLAVLIPVLFGYNKLYSMLDDPRTLVSCVAALYACLFLFISFALLSETETGETAGEHGASRPRYLGWLAYWTIESFGSVFVAMLWSITATVSDGLAARVVYPAIVVFEQLGAVGGATLATYTGTFGTG